MKVEAGQVWDFCDGLVVLVLRPRPDVEAAYEHPPGTYWDTLVLVNEGCRGDEGLVDWMAVGGTASWVRLA